MQSEPAPVPAAELTEFFETCMRAFHEDPRPDDVALHAAMIDADRTLAIRDGSRIVATAGAFTQTLTVPGGEVPAAAVTAVGVLPEHTRRGLMGTLMRRQLADLHAAGRDAVAILWASEPAIYGRYGYGPASRSLTLAVRTREPGVALARGEERPRLLAIDEARPALPAIYDAVRPTRPGLVARTEPWWNHRLHDPEYDRDGFSELRAAVLADGYVLYRAKVGWEDGAPAGAIAVRELIAKTPEAEGALWAYLLGIDLVRSLSWELAPPDEALPLRIEHAAVRRTRIGDGLWLRLLDVDRALAARAYSAPFEVVLEVEDAVCPWNAGRRRLAWDGSAAASEPTAAPADLQLTSAELGAAYLGGTTLAELHRAGRVQELRAGTLHAASVAFRGTLEPWCPEIF
jgi:predicted acetyltransferase